MLKQNPASVEADSAVTHVSDVADKPLTTSEYSDILVAGLTSRKAHIMQTLNEYLETLRAQKRDLEVRIATIEDAINATSPNQPVTARETTQPQPPGPQLPQSPSLDNLRMRDAIRLYLAWRADIGLPPATLGELEKELARHNVVSFRNKAMSTMLYGWKSLCNGLGSPNNMKLWNIERKDPDGHFTRADVITLATRKE